MEEYIPKLALVTEIERRRDAALMRQHNLEALGQETCYNKIIANELNRILQYIGSLKVKKVDLDKEIYLIENKYHGFESLSRADIIDIAKHFFELGLKA